MRDAFDAFDAMPNSFFSDLSKPRLCGMGPGTGILHLQINAIHLERAVPGVYGAFNLEHYFFGYF